jgi:hypothetical protein
LKSHATGVVVHQLPELRQVLHQRRNDLFRRADIAQRVRDNEGLQPGETFERDLRNHFFVEFLDIHAPHVGHGHRGRAKLARVADGKIDLVLGRDPALERDAICVRRCIAVLVLGEIETLFFRQSGLEVGSLAYEA